MLQAMLTQEEEAILSSMPSSQAGLMAAEEAAPTSQGGRTFTSTCCGYYIRSTETVDGKERLTVDPAAFDTEITVEINSDTNSQQTRRLPTRNFPYSVMAQDRHVGEVQLEGGRVVPMGRVEEVCIEGAKNQRKSLACVPVMVPDGQYAGDREIMQGPMRQTIAVVSIVQGSSVYDLVDRMHRLVADQLMSDWLVADIMHNEVVAYKPLQRPSHLQAYDAGLTLSETHLAAVVKGIKSKGYIA